MSSRAVQVTLSAAILLYALAALASCDGSPTAVPKPVQLPRFTPHQDGVQLPSGLVTETIGATCIECHEDVVNAYRTSAMHESLTLPAGAGSVEAGLVGRSHTDPETGITVTFGAQDGGYVQSAVYVDPLGEERARFDMRVDLVIGSGHATRSYFQIENGRLLELPLTWYRDLGNLALSPGGGFRGELLRNSTRTCVACHTGTVQPVSPDADLGFKGTISLGISCGRCHGPGAEHVSTGDPQSIVNPSRLEEARQADLCFQCHLSSGLTVERRGRTIADYRPGDNLADWLGVMTPVAARASDGANIAGHAERMQASRCYVASHESGDNPMTCTTCHNPHRGHLGKDATAEADRGCLVCHQEDACHADEAARQGRHCFSCHMPEIASRDIAHTRITDHLIVRKPKTGATKPPAQHPGEVALRGGPLANGLDLDDQHPLRHLFDARAYLAGAEIAWVLVEQRADDWLQRSLDALASHEAALGEDSETLAIRGRALALRGATKTALPFLERARDQEPNLPSSHAEYGYALAASGKVVEGVEAVRKAVVLDPYDGNTARTLADMLAHLNRHREALDALDASRGFIGPSLRKARLGRDIASRSGDTERALKHAYDVLLFRPNDAGSLWHAGRLAEQLDQDIRVSQALFERALRSDPDFVPALISLGLQFVDQDMQRARQLAARAQRLAPDLPQLNELLKRLR